MSKWTGELNDSKPRQVSRAVEHCASATALWVTQAKFAIWSVPPAADFARTRLAGRRGFWLEPIQNGTA